jgi:hypothetical protein
VPWTPFAPWMHVQRKPEAVTAASCADAAWATVPLKDAEMTTWISLFAIAAMISSCLYVAAVAIDGEG